MSSDHSCAVRLGGWSLACCVLALLGIGAAAPWSASGWTGVVALGLIAIGALLREQRARRRVATFGLALIVALFGVRLVCTGSARTRMVTLPGGTSSRWLGSLIDEQDVSLLGARVLTRLWRLPAEESGTLVPAMRDGYVQLRAEHGVTASPVLDTLTARQSPRAFDTIIFEPPSGAPAHVAVVFLHGFAGSFTLQCWLIAKAAGAIDAITVCPATSFSGKWGERDGAATVRATLDDLHARGIHRVYLAGLSNGAAGASALAPQLASSLAGLILISGAPSQGSSGGLPALVMHGNRDSMASASSARAFATRNHATYASLDGGHFALLVRSAEGRAAIGGWLRKREGH